MKCVFALGRCGMCAAHVMVEKIVKDYVTSVAIHSQSVLHGCYRLYVAPLILNMLWSIGQVYPDFKHPFVLLFLQKAIELNPRDPTCRHLLGQW